MHLHVGGLACVSESQERLSSSFVGDDAVKRMLFTTDSLDGPNQKTNILKLLCESLWLCQNKRRY